MNSKYIEGNNTSKDDASSLGDLPPELLINISEHIAAEALESGSISAGSDLLNFGNAAQFTRAATNATSQLREVKRRTMESRQQIEHVKTELKYLGEDIFDAAARDGRIPPDQPADSVRETVDVLGSLLHEQSADRRKNFATSIMGIQKEGVRINAIAQSVKYFKALDARDRAPLIHESIDVFTGTVTTHRNHSIAREAIANAKDFLQPDHNDALKTKLAARFDGKDLEDSLSLEMERQAKRSATALRRQEASANIPIISSEHDINLANAEFDATIKTTEPRSFERMDRLAPLANTTAGGLNSARQALMGSERSRDSNSR